MPTVSVYGQDVDFPDSMSDDEIVHAIQTSGAFGPGVKNPVKENPPDLKPGKEGSDPAQEFKDTLVNDVKAIPGTLKGLATHPVDTLTSGMKPLRERAVSEFKKRDYPEAVIHGIEGITPVLGPMTSEYMEDTANPNSVHFGRGAARLTEITAPKVAEKIPIRATGKVLSGAAKGAVQEGFSPAQMNLPVAGKVNVPKFVKTGTVGAEIGGAGQYFGHVPGGAEIGAGIGAVYPFAKGAVKGGVKAFKNLGEKTPEVKPFETTISHEFVEPESLPKAESKLLESPKAVIEDDYQPPEEKGSEFHGREEVPEDWSEDKITPEHQAAIEDINTPKNNAPKDNVSHEKELFYENGGYKVYKAGSKGYEFHHPNGTITEYWGPRTPIELADEFAEKYPISTGDLGAASANGQGAAGTPAKGPSAAKAAPEPASPSLPTPKPESVSSEPKYPVNEDRPFSIIKNEELTTPEMDAVHYYKGSGYKSIHEYLHKGLPHPKVAALDSAINKFELQHPAKLYRGVSGDYAHALKQLKEGDVFTNMGYTSTSSSPTHSFSGSVQVEIQVPKGQKAYPFGFNDSEKEMLLPRNMKFQILKKTASGPDWNQNVKIVVQPVD